MTRLARTTLYLLVLIVNTAFSTLWLLFPPGVFIYNWLVEDIDFYYGLQMLLIFHGFLFLPICFILAGLLSAILLRKKPMTIILAILIPVFTYSALTSLYLYNEVTRHSGFGTFIRLFLIESIVPSILFSFIQLGTYTLLFGKRGKSRLETEPEQLSETK